MMEKNSVVAIAGAIEKSAEFGIETNKSIQGLAAFVKAPFEQIMGSWTDGLKVWRWERQLRFADRVQTVLAERGLTQPTRQIPLGLALPLIERATMEDDDDLQNCWARMLANAGDANSPEELRHAFISILSDMSAFDVKILAHLAQADFKTADVPRMAGTHKFGTWLLPEKVISLTQEISAEAIPNEEVAISLSNLVRIGCIVGSGTYGGGTTLSFVSLTPIGKAFAKACMFGSNVDNLTASA